MKKYLLPLGIAALLLSGCSAESTESEPAANDALASPTATANAAAENSDGPADGMGPGSYTFESGDGAVGTLEVPGAAPVDIEELRAMIGAEPVAYLTGSLDNRNGSESFDVYTISVYDPEGNKYDYEPAQDYMHSITSIEAPDEIYDKYSALYDQYSTVVDAMERKDFVMVGPELPAEIAGVSISNGFDDFGAMPAG